MPNCLVISRIGLIYILAFLIGFPITVSSQTKPGLLLDISFNGESLDMAIRKIEKLYPVVLVYDAQQLSAYHAPTGSWHKKSPQFIIKQLLKNTPFKLMDSGGRIIIFKKKLSGLTVFNGWVSGKDGMPLPGITVQILGTNLGTVTDKNGRFSLHVKNGVYNVTFTSIAYDPLTIPGIPLNNDTVVDHHFVMQEREESLQQFVVTALGISRPRSTLGYALTEIKSPGLNNVEAPNILQALSGKIPGLQVRGLSPDPGASVYVVLRGESSFNGNSQPLFVVDGIPITANSSVAGKVDYGNRLSDLSIEDIASISVLRGAGAAALYGSRAGNGVVVITTKTGNPGGSSWKVTASSSLMIDKAWQFPHFQNLYGAGTDVLAEDTWGEASWGPELNDGSYKVQWNSPRDDEGNFIPLPWTAYPGRVRDYFQLGQTFQQHIAVNKSFEKGAARFSVLDTRNRGIIPNTGYNKDVLMFSLQYKFDPKIQFNTNLSYTYSSSDNRFSGDRGSVINQLYTMPANVNTNELRNYWKPGKEGIEQQSYLHDMYSGQAQVDNPFLIAYEQTNAYFRHRLNGLVQIKWTINDYLNLALRSGIDQFYEYRERKKPFSSVNFINGFYEEAKLFSREINSDLLLQFHKQFYTVWNISADFGMNRMDQKNYDYTIAAQQLKVPSIYSLSNGVDGSFTYQSDFARKRVNSTYATMQASYKDILFVNASGRMDWSSTLPRYHNAYFYPAIASSILLTRLLNLGENNWVNRAKFRANWAKVGKDTDPYNLYNTFQYIANWDGISRADIATMLKNKLLKPEITTATEVGLELGMFKERLGLDITVYQSTNKNQIIAVPLAISSGYSERLMNAGNIRNRGIELQLSWHGNKKPLHVQYEGYINFSKNWDKIVALDPGIPNGEIYLSGGEGASVLAKVGGRMGDMYGGTYKKVPGGPYKGAPWLTASGQYQLEGGAYEKFGNYNPDFMLSWNHGVKYKNWFAGALLDWRQGGTFYSYTAKNLQSDGRVDVTLPGRDASQGGLPWVDGNGKERHDGMILYGYNLQDDGTFAPNDVILSPEAYYGNYYWDFPARNAYSATYIKLRELSLGYNFLHPAKWIQNVRLVFMARNLFAWNAAGTGFDPETSNKIENSRYQLGINTWTLPGIKTFGFKIDCSF